VRELRAMVPIKVLLRQPHCPRRCRCAGLCRRLAGVSCPHAGVQRMSDGLPV
jgi:hypothetical protein